MEEFEVEPTLLEMYPRCDVCIQEAKQVVGAGILPPFLYFCQHHFNKHEPALFAAGWVKVVKKKISDDLDTTPAKV